MTQVIAASDTRSRILEAALQLIAEKGYAGTSTRELSERLGFTKAALYYHFRTKEDLLVALVQPGIDQFRQLLARPAGRGAVDRRDLVAGYINLVMDHRELTRVISQDPATRSITRLTEMSRPLYAELIDRLTDGHGHDARALARAHVALGGVHAALMNHAPDADIEDVRAGALAAACGALGL